MNEEQARELAIRILAEFEELLAEKGIMVPSQDREGNPEEACLYGSEYYALEDGVVGVLMGEAGGPDARVAPASVEAKTACEAMRREMAAVPEGLAKWRGLGESQV